MKLRFLLFLSALFVSLTNVSAQCIEITSILINACNPTSDEEDNEMLAFTVGANPINVSDINVTWPNISFNGFCTSPSATAGLNATITNGCGYLLEPPLGQIPANANVLLITSDNVSTVDNSFSSLTDTLYVIYQCDGGSTAQFVNSPGVGTRTTTLTISGPCSQVESVTYDRQFITNTDGERVNFDAAGNATYDNTQGCTALVTGLSVDWAFTNEICNDYGIVDLTTLLAGSATPGGTWSGPRVVGTDYNPTGYLGLDSVSYTIAGTGTCTANIDSTIVFNVVSPQTGSVTTQSCDSIFYNGVWYVSSSNFTDTLLGAGFLCDSFTNVSITIQNAITDSTYLSSCDSVNFNGTAYLSDVILRDTIFGNIGGPIVIDTILQTSFEDSEGWTDHNSGNWTQLDAFGTWNAVDMYANQFNPNNGARNVGMNNVGDYLELPPVSNPQTLYYYDRLSSAASGTNELTIEYFDGTNWQAISSDICTHIDYQLVTVDLTSISALTNVALRIYRSQDDRSAYIDDIVIEGSTTGAVSSCDSIFITNINILDPVTTNNPANPIVICSTNDSTQLADGSFVSAAGTYPILYPSGSANGCDSSYVTLVQTQNCNFTCTFDTVLYDSFETPGAIPGLVPGSTFHPNTQQATSPPFTGLSNTGTRFFYMNFQNGYSGQVYTRTVDVCAGSDFRYSFWIRQFGTGLGSDFDINIYDGVGTAGTLIFNQNIVNNGTTYNLRSSPQLSALSNQVTFELITNTPGASGNDLCLDDLVFEVCTTDSVQVAAQSYCNTSIPDDLYTYVNSFAGANGTWSGPSALGNGYLGTFNPTTNAFGTYYYTVAGVSACGDTIISINTTSSSGQEDTISIVGCDSVQTDGVWYFTNTILRDTIVNGASNGCDSIFQTNIGIINSVTVNNPNNPLVICASNDSVQLPDGSFATTAGTYPITYVSNASCDSTYVTVVSTQICNCQFDLGPDTALCQGESIVLDASPGFDTYTWQDNSTNQTFTVTTTGTYYVTTTFIDSTNNLVVNGDFEQGNTGFTTDYGPGVGGAFGLLTNAGTYAINTSPSNVHNNFFTCADNTSGSGNMMIVNGSNIPNTNVWCQTITVNPNTDYVFSAWAMSLENTNFSNVATLHFLIDGIQIGPNFSPSFTACDWQQFSTTWNSNASNTIQICIESDVISGNNDYALDDIFFTPFCNSTDSIDITVNPIPTPDIGPDLSICQGTNTTLDATTTGASYLWQDGTTSSATFTAQNAGLYWVDVTVDNCTGRDSVNLGVNPVFNQTANLSICDGDSAFLEGAWQTNSGTYTDNFTSTSGCDSVIVSTLNVVTSQTQNEVIEVCADELPVDIFGTPTSTPGNYADTISSALGCDSLISNIELIVNPLPSVSLGSDTSIDAGNSLVLTVDNASAGDTYSWTNSLGETFNGESITTSPNETATYILTSVNQFNCASIDSLVVIVNPLEEVLLQIPTAFSPNGDGVNDVFRIANFEDFESYTLRIYNRWGELIFDNEGFNVSWDGSYQGLKQNVGVYAFYIKATPITGASEMVISGNVTLIR